MTPAITMLQRSQRFSSDILEINESEQNEVSPRQNYATTTTIAAAETTSLADLAVQHENDTSFPTVEDERLSRKSPPFAHAELNAAAEFEIPQVPKNKGGRPRKKRRGISRASLNNQSVSRVTSDRTTKRTASTEGRGDTLKRRSSMRNNQTTPEDDDGLVAGEKILLRDYRVLIDGERLSLSVLSEETRDWVRRQFSQAPDRLSKWDKYTGDGMACCLARQELYQDRYRDNNHAYACLICTNNGTPCVGIENSGSFNLRPIHPEKLKMSSALVEDMARYRKSSTI